MTLKNLENFIIEPIVLCDKEGQEILRGYIEDLHSLNLYGMPSGSELLNCPLISIEWAPDALEVWLSIKLPRIRYCGGRKDLETGRSYAIFAPGPLYKAGYCNIVQNMYGQYNILLLPGEWTAEG